MHFGVGGCTAFSVAVSHLQGEITEALFVLRPADRACFQELLQQRLLPQKQLLYDLIQIIYDLASGGEAILRRFCLLLPVQLTVCAIYLPFAPNTLFFQRFLSSIKE